MLNEYDEEFASYFIHNRLPEHIAERLEPIDIRFILSIEEDYLDSIGLLEEFETEDPPTITVDEDELEYYVIYHAVKFDIFLSYEDLREIISLEIDYLMEIGLASVADEAPLAPF